MLVVRRVTAPGPVTFHWVAVVLSWTVVSVWPSAENASAAFGQKVTGAGDGTAAWSVAVFAG
jgi:hypothetical protein